MKTAEMIEKLELRVSEAIIGVEKNSKRWLPRLRQARSALDYTRTANTEEAEIHINAPLVAGGTSAYIARLLAYKIIEE